MKGVGELHKASPHVMCIPGGEKNGKGVEKGPANGKSSLIGGSRPYFCKTKGHETSEVETEAGGTPNQRGDRGHGKNA